MANEKDLKNQILTLLYGRSRFLWQLHDEVKTHFNFQTYIFIERLLNDLIKENKVIKTHLKYTSTHSPCEGDSIMIRANIIRLLVNLDEPPGSLQAYDKYVERFGDLRFEMFVPSLLTLEDLKIIEGPKWTLKDPNFWHAS